MSSHTVAPRKYVAELVHPFGSFGFICLGAGSRWYLQGQQARRKALEINPFSFLVDELGPESRVSGSGLPKGALSGTLKSTGSGFSSGLPPNPFQGQFEGANRSPASLHSNIVATGDSATETAGRACSLIVPYQCTLSNSMKSNWALEPQLVIGKSRDVY